ncbi:MAG: S8 family serine peptidase [Fidelibacterota bacterium]|nr:MAG: S8 family serine peptidase [Candidatus Neomarinimicrobiota bacterium]
MRFREYCTPSNDSTNRRTSALILASALLLGIIAPTHGQLAPRQAVNAPALEAQSADLHRQFVEENRAARELLAARGYPLRTVLSTGKVLEIQRLRHGRPLYYTTTNLNAASTISTDLLWPGGTSGLNLDGTGMLIGEWDEGAVLKTHQEFGGRVSVPVDSNGASDHATHVAGTMIAAGMVPTAIGMAPAASLRSYDWDDDLAEMAAEAAAGLQGSNHSYAYVAGWEYDFLGDGLWCWFGDPAIHTTRDYIFGLYMSESAAVDQLVIDAPHYLPVLSASNDRSDNGPASGVQYWIWNTSTGQWVLNTTTRDTDGDYDCIPGGKNVAKNALLVGAVDDIPNGYTAVSDVVMSSFSSWGPTDDGRIKPDLVANGIWLYSSLAISPTSYGLISGTSMAAPSVAGSLALLQQHYAATHEGQYLSAAALKALVIHTCDEAGPAPGPDYSFGWGLMNTSSAASLISADQLADETIRMGTLAEGTIQSFAFLADGSGSMKTTLVWADPPGVPPGSQYNPRTPMLVNDLDVRIERATDGLVYLPWALNVEAPTAPASPADNSVDNVEQVLISTPDPGLYMVSVSHKGSLQDISQPYALITTGAQAVRIASVTSHTPDVVVIGQPTMLTIEGENLDTVPEVLISREANLENPPQANVDGTELSVNLTVHFGEASGPATLTLVTEIDSIPLPLTLVQPHFVPVYSGNPYLAMNFFVTAAQLDDVDLESTDEIGIFDGQYCVGAAALDGPITQYLAIVAATDDPTTTEIDGFTPGHDIYYRFWDNSADMEVVNVQADYSSGDGMFASQATAVVDLAGAYAPSLVHFQPVYTGHPYLAMNIFVTSAQVGGVDLEMGDEIGIYYKDRCVGAAALAGPISQYLAMVAATDDPTTTEVDGFVSGNEILYRYWDSSAGVELTDVQATYSTGDGLFASQGTAVVALERSPFSVDPTRDAIPAHFALHQNYPNPFNLVSVINYDLAEGADVVLQILDLAGREVNRLVHGHMEPGYHRVLWDGTDFSGKVVPSGVYVARLLVPAQGIAPEFSQSVKMLLLK